MKRGLTAALLMAGLLGTRGAQAQAIQNVVLRNSFDPLGAGARGLGMGGAFIGVADDGTAASFNPAGLAQLRRTEFAAVGFSDRLNSTVLVPGKDVEDQSYESHAHHARPDFFGLALPFDVGGHNLVAQLSYQRAVDLFGQGRATVQDTIALSEVNPDLKGTGDVIADIVPAQSGAFHNLSLSAGYQLTSRLALGTSLNYWFASWTAEGESNFRLRTHPPAPARPVDVPLLTEDFHQDQGMHGFNLNLGLLLKYARLSVGGVVRLPFSGDYDLQESDSAVTFQQGTAQPARPITFDVKTPLRWPLSAGLGLALRPLRGLTLAGDFTQSHWSRTSLDDVPAGALLTPQNLDANGNPQDSFTTRNFFDLLPASETDTVDTGEWRAGGEYLLTSIPKVVVPLRAGAFHDRSPIRELGTTEGRLIKGWTAGSGLNFTHVVVDVAFERRESEGLVSLRLRAGQPANLATAPKETVREDRIVVSLIYRFSDDDPIKRGLRYLFVGPEQKENP
jgi:long-chain fatty acid transport protein